LYRGTSETIGTPETLFDAKNGPKSIKKGDITSKNLPKIPTFSAIFAHFCIKKRLKTPDFDQKSRIKALFLFHYCKAISN